MSNKDRAPFEKTTIQGSMDMTDSEGESHISNRNGRTVGGTTADDNGEEKTVTWPETATPKSELNETQIAVIKAAANPAKQYETFGELSEDAAPDMSNAYSASTLNDHWPAGREHIEGGSGSGSTDGGEQNHNKQGFDADFVDELRRRMLDGASAKELGEEYPHKPLTISAYAKGERDPVGETTEPPLEWDQSTQEWVPQDGQEAGSGERQNGSEVNNTAERNPVTATAAGDDTDGRLKTAVAVLVAFVLGWVIGR